MEFIIYCFEEHPIASIMIIIFATILIWHCVRTSISKEVNENGEEITKFRLSSDAKKTILYAVFFSLALAGCNRCLQEFPNASKDFNEWTGEPKNKDPFNYYNRHK